jgi:hypothetical protein
VADGVEALRRFGVNKPLIFCLTSPGYVDNANAPRFLKKYLDVLKYNGMGSYVWVREFTKKGYPHFHFVADMPLPVGSERVRLSCRWSSYFGSEAKNSVRFGTKPVPGKPRIYHINSPQMAFYMSKYIGKALSGDERKEGRRRPRTFCVSPDLSPIIEPVVYEESVVSLWTGMHQRIWETDIVDPDGVVHVQRFNPGRVNWRRAGVHPVYVGVPDTWKKQKRTENYDKP